MHEHAKINYVEFPAKNIEETKTFFQSVFNWTFEDFGPEYTAFSNQGIDGGFYKADLHSDSTQGAALIVFYSNNLADTLSRVEQAGGKIVKPIFAFPGGHRFHFTEPSGNELAVWSDCYQ